jgi:hypothetical protein
MGQEISMSKIQVDVGSVSRSNERKGNDKNLFVQVPVEVLEAGVSTSALKLYLILLKYARQSNECWPSQQTLGWDMNLKPRRIADLLKELEMASLITIISRAKEGLSNLYRLLKLVSPKGNSDPSLPKTTDGAAKKDLPGKQKNAGEGMQDFADESHAVEKHALNTHTHIQPNPAKEVVSQPTLDFGKPAKGVCDFKDSDEESSDECKGSGLTKRVERPSLHTSFPVSDKGQVIKVLTGYGVSEVKARQLAATINHAKLDEEYIEGLIEWINDQASSRTIYNPAGLLVQMVSQLAPVPLPKGFGIPTLNDLQMGFEQKREFLEKHLPRQIFIEERNLAEATSEQDRLAIQNKLDKLLALQAKEQAKLLRLEKYSPTNFPGATQPDLTSTLSIQARQHQQQLITEKGAAAYGPVF